MINVKFLDKYIDEYSKVFPFSGVLRVTERDKIIYERNITQLQ